MSTGYPYPIPWRLLPANIFLTLYCIYKYLSDPIRRGVARQLLGRTGVELRTMVDLFTGGGGGQSVGPKILVSSWAELDFDLGTIPDHVVPCGPIVQVSRAVAEAEPELEAWMSRGPVIYVNLGSMCMLTEDRAVGLARGLRDFVRGDPAAERMQILWKIKKQGEYDVGPGSRLYDVLGPSIESGSVRIVDWLVTEPMAILQSGHVRCSVHHGGANSYNEAVV